MTIAQEHPNNALDLLRESVDYIRSLYPEEHAHGYDIDELTNHGARFFICRRDGITVGCAAYVWHDHHLMEIKHMFVSSKVRGQGVGASLLQTLEDHGRMDRAERCILETSRKQDAAIRLYSSFGYTNCVPYTEYHADDVFMEKLFR